MTDATAAAIAGELALLDPAVRADRHAASKLIDPDFLEIGQTGRRWDNARVLSEFGGPSKMSPVTVSEMDARTLGPDTVLVTYVATSESRSVRRSSIWRDSPQGWRVVFHQGTRIDGA